VGQRLPPDHLEHEAIAKPDDLKNFKIRVPVVPLWVAMFKAIGAPR
jgi:TRAP-type C4-dicarboxylate transport system substrate-binding protein